MLYGTKDAFPLGNVHTACGRHPSETIPMIPPPEIHTFVSFLSECGVWAGPSDLLIASSFLWAYSCTRSPDLSDEASCHVMRELWESSHGKVSREVLGQ